MIPGVSTLLKQNVLTDVHQLYRLTLPIDTVTGNAGGIMRPPIVLFAWGPFQFTGVITDLSFDIKLFDGEGLPRRATANVTIKGRALQSIKKVDDLFDPTFNPEVESQFSPEKKPLFGDKRIDLLSTMKKSLVRYK